MQAWQSQCGEFAKVLPSPLPMTMDDSHSLTEDGDKEEDKVSIGNTLICHIVSIIGVNIIWWEKNKY